MKSLWGVRHFFNNGPGWIFYREKEIMFHMIKDKELYTALNMLLNTLQQKDPLKMSENSGAILNQNNLL